jgi:vacuolar-type H+-ATPase subunit I/STV1
MNYNLLLETIGFLAIANSFFVIFWRRWRNLPPYHLPEPLPSWFTPWLYIVLIVGILLPVGALLWWGVFLGNRLVVEAIAPYLLLVGLQVLSESVTLNQLQSCVWVTVPFVYIPYRIWQLARGAMLLGEDSGTLWVQRLLILEIGVWVINYLLDLSEIPRLLRWDIQEESEG